MAGAPRVVAGSLFLSAANKCFAAGLATVAEFVVYGARLSFSLTPNFCATVALAAASVGANVAAGTSALRAADIPEPRSLTAQADWCRILATYCNVSVVLNIQN